MPRILVVDDDPIILRLMRIRLVRLGYSVETALTAEEALVQFSLTPVDLVITDIHMPGMSGLDLIDRLQDTDATVPIIVITASVSGEDYLAAISAGAVDFLGKPVSSRELAAVVERCLHVES